MNQTDKEIQKASDAIDRALSHMNKTNRGETAVNILSVVRNLNDHAASKIWSDIEPNQPMDINKVASKLINKRPFKSIGILDKFLRKSVSHFTPSLDGAERLLIKYYRYLLEIKKLLKVRYNIEIIQNIDNFLEKLDNQTEKYYTEVAKEISLASQSKQGEDGFDNYYINKVKPFFVNKNIYFEVTLEPAEERPNKFNRITAFTKHDIMTNYAVALRFSEGNINAFGVKLPIKIITDWRVSIRPCEINNFAQILEMDINIARGYNEYKALMDFLTSEQMTLVDIIDLPNDDYNYVKKLITETTKEKHSDIFAFLDICRSLSITKSFGANILRYLLCRMNNRIIKLQWPDDPSASLNDFHLHKKCYPFEQKPFVFNPKGHISNIYDLLECIDSTGREPELLARHVRSNTEQGGNLFMPIAELTYFGNTDDIKKFIDMYNKNLYSGFRPESELGIYGDNVYSNKHEQKTFSIINSLKNLTLGGSSFVNCFSKNAVNELKDLSDINEKLDDPIKEKILLNLFRQSRVQFIYGSAGTGKSRIVNHIARLMMGKRRIFIAKTNPAVENLRRKVRKHEANDEFITIDRFIKNPRYKSISYDMIVVDECSTVKNEEMVKILNMLGEGVLVLAGDTYQIEAIGFGNWFSLVSKFIPKHCCHELMTPYRSTDEHLKSLWNEVRNMSGDNTALEQIVRNDYSHKIDETIFAKKEDDEIILCLNYNGLYGLNNINKLLQIGNPNKGVEIGIWLFKKGDPILFNDSERFKILFNNLKGRIIDIEDHNTRVKFTVEVELNLQKEEVKEYSDLELLRSNDKSSVLSFWVNRRPPYSSDEEEKGKTHIMPFQVAYAVSIHKSQGLEYDSVKIVIADDSEELITHNIFYTAITRAKKQLTLFWSPEVCNRVLSKLSPKNDNKDYLLLRNKHNLQEKA